MPPVTLVLGGARSGKSTYAEQLAMTAETATYIATAEPGDAEMVERIRLHQQRRGPRWTTVEEPLNLLSALSKQDDPSRPIVVDCLTLWLSNLMLSGRDVEAETANLAALLGDLAGPVILVANEVGLGIVPETPLGRRYRDHAGCLNRTIAEIADRVVFMIAGLPLIVKEQNKNGDALS
ncbi:MAG: bifunctional adenosylcobinamide kinase/adenosylcobinamide-phosphate guanylyltransferase [Hyphomicrobiales bacterium]|nr:bifunctional adenosylcobinamide kinase/adenosylcobinamide-phosphate guanylyltransferase [Hyphomicrobiales bacterium]